MPHTNAAVQSVGDAQIVEEHHVADPHGEHDNRSTDEPRRHWYQPPAGATPTH